MRSNSIRRWFMAFVLGAFLCAGLGQPMPVAEAASMPGMTMAMDGADGMPMPCKNTVLNCFTDIGCIFIVALPPAYTPTVVQLAWSRIVYASVTASHVGMSLKPDPGPPIHV